MRVPGTKFLSLFLVTIAVCGVARAGETPRQKEEHDKIMIAARLLPIPGVESKAGGTLHGYYDFYTHELEWDVKYRNLSSRVISAKIRGPSKPGHDAGVLVPLMPPFGTPILGIVTVTGKQAADITGGYAYVVICTIDHPKGELRGRIRRMK